MNPSGFYRLSDMSTSEGTWEGEKEDEGEEVTDKARSKHKNTLIE